MRPLVAALTLSILAFGYSAPAIQTTSGAIDLRTYRLHLVYSNDFTLPQKVVREENMIAQATDGSWRRRTVPPGDAEWIAEGWGGAEVRDGKLRVAPSPFDAAGHLTPVPQDRRSHMVVWNRREFPDDFLMEFEMSPCGSTNGLTIVLFCGRGTNGRGLFDLSLPPRRGEYRTYHSGAIANYTDSYWSRNTETESISNRLRRNPGFKEVASGASLTLGATDVTHRVRILKSGAHIEVEINGSRVLEWNDPEKPLGRGHIGFRSMEGVTMVTYDNFKVWRLERRAPPIKRPTKNGS